MKFSNCILANGKVFWVEPETEDTIFHLPLSKKYCTAETFHKGYDFIIKESGPVSSVKQHIPIAAIAQGSYTIFPELLEENEIQPYCMALVGPKGTFKTTLCRKVRYPSVKDNKGEITQEMDAKEKNAIITECRGGSVFLNDLRGGGNDDEKVKNLVNRVVRPVSDRKDGPVTAILNGEPSFLKTKRLGDSIRERMLPLPTESLHDQENWVVSFPYDLVPSILVSSYGGICSRYDIYSKFFSEESKKNFLNKSSKYKNVRIRNYRFLMRMAHRIILTEANITGYLTKEETDYYQKEVFNAIDCLCDQMIYQLNPMEYLVNTTFCSLSGQIRNIEKRFFCNYSESGSKKCSENYFYFPYDWNKCPDREFRINNCDCAIRTETEAGIAISASDFGHKLPYLIDDDEKVLLIIEKGRFWQEFWHQASYAKKAMNVKTPQVSIKDMQKHLVEKGYLMYDPLAEEKKEQYYTKWPVAKLLKKKFTFADVTKAGETEVFVMYVPQKLLPNLCTDKGFYLGVNDYEFEMPFKDIAKRHVNCVLN